MTIEGMRSSRVTVNTIFTTFVTTENDYIKRGLETFFFFEGIGDKKYYFKKMENLLKKEYGYLECGGKENVIKVMEKIKKNHNAKLPLYYFVDKDFDDKYNIEGLYETPVYSIENFYIFEKSFIKILITEFNLNPNESEKIREEFENVIDVFRKRLEEFLNEIDLLNAWCWIQKKEAENPNFKALGDLRELNFIKIKLTEVKSEYNLENLKEKTINFKDVTEEYIYQKIKEFQALDRVSFYRGKYLIYFLEEFLKRLIDDSNKKKDREVFFKKRKNSLNLGGNFDILSNFASYSLIPKCLEDFVLKI